MSYQYGKHLQLYRDIKSGTWVRNNSLGNLADAYCELFDTYYKHLAGGCVLAGVLFIIGLSIGYWLG